MFKRSLIVNFAPTGAVADQKKNPAVPTTMHRIIEDVVAARRAGASIAHLHVRSDDASPSCDPDRFGKLFAALRNHPECADLILCASTSGRHGQSPEERAAVLDLPRDVRPEMASLTLGSLNFPSGVSINAPETIRYLAQRMKQRGIKPELEVFDVGMISFAKALINEGLLTPPYYFNIILGNMDGLEASATHLAFALSLLPDQSLVSVGGIGRYQFEATALGMVAADGIRVGLEDNLWAAWEPTKVPASNAGLIDSCLRVANALGRAIAKPLELREQLALNG